ncbi:MAG: hypothetical protein II668_04030 [Oscillospiraceae bacterium]|nr:hypothetical protein [Oscillospiraceae bacterium]
MGLFTKIFGTRSQREVKKFEPIIEKIDALENEYRGLSDYELKAKTEEFKSRYAAGETLDDLLPEAFAAVREASDRVLGMRHFRVQLIGGIVLHQGRIAEMKTGEGKTLVATLPAYLNALTGQGVHIVTVNDYLAKRDSEWMGKIYRFLGLSVGLIVHGLTNDERRRAYAADITYGTNNEIGFDYLRDNMALYKHQMVQRGHVFAIVDEVDSILIDEARTPLIISGTGDESTDLYRQADDFVRRLRRIVYASTDEKEDLSEVDADFVVDEKARTAKYTEALSEFGLKITENGCFKLEGTGVNIISFSAERKYYKRNTKIEMEPEYIRETVGAPDPDSFNILLAHNPGYFEAYAGYGAELTLSGHLHGGLVRIPVPVSKKAKEAGAHIMRGVFSPRLRFFPKYDAGRFDIDGRTMVVSRGLGSHTLPVRVFNPGDLVVIDLKPPSGV